MLCGSCGHSASSMSKRRTLTAKPPSVYKRKSIGRADTKATDCLIALVAVASISVFLIYVTPLRKESAFVHAPVFLLQLLLAFVALPSLKRLRAAAVDRLNRLSQPLASKYQVNGRLDFVAESVSLEFIDFKRQHNRFWLMYVVSASVLVMSCVCKNLQPSQFGCVLLYFPIGVVDLMEGELVTRTNMPSLLALIVVAYVCTMWYMLLKPVSVSMFGTTAMRFGPVDLLGSFAWGMSYCLSWCLRVLCPTPMKMSKTLEIMALLSILKLGCTCAQIWATELDGEPVPASAWSQIEVDITITGVSAVVVTWLRLHMEEKNLASFLCSRIANFSSSVKTA